jgi:hypothetical protein
MIGSEFSGGAQMPGDSTGAAGTDSRPAPEETDARNQVT